MSDNYDAVYQAVRSRISQCNFEDVINNVLSNSFGNTSHVIQCSFADIASELTRPSILLRPKISIDGDQWRALYGDNLQDGVAGFGKSPDEAFRNFDENWRIKLELKCI